MSEEKKEPEIIETTTYDERRKVLIHKSSEEKTNDLGDLKITTSAEIHEKGIRQTIKEYENRKKIYKKNIEVIKEAIGTAPEMTPELEILEKQIQKLNLINRKKAETEASRKKDADDLEHNEKDLKLVEKDLRNIKSAIGTRLKL